MKILFYKNKFKIYLNLNFKLNLNNENELLKNSIIGYFNPIRTINQKCIPKDSIKFCKDFWEKILYIIFFKLIIVIDQQTYKYIKQILNKLYNNSIGSEKKLPINWGKICAKRYTINNIFIVYLPHLSRFKIFGKTFNFNL